MEKICNVSFGKENWSQASLPIRHAGLGLRSTADLSLPCFLSSSHACKGLVNRLLPSLNLDIPYGDVNNAIDDWTKHHDSSPLEKGTQAAWDDLAYRDALNSLLNTNNPWNHCRLLAAQETRESHCRLVRSVPNRQCWKLAQSRWALYCNHPPNWCQNPWKLKMPLWLWQSCWRAGAPWPLLY